MWRNRQPIAGTIAETYLRQARGIRCPLPSTLGFLPARDDYPPAMIAAFGMATEPEPGLLAIHDMALRGVHLTRLLPDGSGKAGDDKAKIMVGRSKGSPIVLAPMNDLLGLAIAEGIEDALSIHQATGLGAWAAGSASRMPALADRVPDWIDCVTILADADADGRKGAAELAEALRRRRIHADIGWRLRLMPKDANDRLRDEGEDGLRKHFDQAERPEAEAVRLFNDVHAFLGRFVVYPSEDAHARPHAVGRPRAPDGRLGIDAAHRLPVARAGLGQDAGARSDRAAGAAPGRGGQRHAGLPVPQGRGSGRPADDPVRRDRHRVRPEGEGQRRDPRPAQRRPPPRRRRRPLRRAGKMVETEEISAYCAVALAGLGDLPDTILSRSVIVKMRRRASDEQVKPFRRRVYAPEGERLRDRLAAWAQGVLAAGDRRLAGHAGGHRGPRRRRLGAASGGGRSDRRNLAAAGACRGCSACSASKGEHTQLRCAAAS